MSIARVFGLLVIVVGMGCGRVAPGTSTNARPGYYGSGGGGGGGGGGTPATGAPDTSKPNCTPTEKGKYGSICR